MDETVFLKFVENLPDTTSIYTTALIPIMAYFIKLSIDNYELTELEKMLMSNFKKFQISLSKYLLIGVAFLSIFNLLLNKQNIVTEENSEVIYVVLLACLILTIAIIFLLEMFIKVIFFIFNIKYEYYIVNEKNEDVYRVIKLSGNNHLLVESEGIYEFIDNFKQKRYNKVAVNSAYIETIYSYRYLNIVLGFMGFIALLLLILVFFNNGITQFLQYVAFVILLLVFLVIFTNSLEFRRENLNNNRGTEETPCERE